MDGIIFKHENNRLKVCGPCGEKIIVKCKQKLEWYKISERHEGLIKRFLNKDFSLSDNKYPISICSSCRLTLDEYANENFTRVLPSMPNYEDILLRKNTRSLSASESECLCYICLTASKKGRPQTSEVGRGKKRPLSTEISTSNGLFAAAPPIPDSNFNSFKKIDQEKKSIKLCSTCFQEIGKGIQHKCSEVSFKQAPENLLKLVNKLSERQKDYLTSLILKQKAESQSLVETNNESQGKKTALLSITNINGSESKVVINPKEDKKVFFTEETLDNFQLNTSSTTNHMKKITNLLRATAGRKSVPKQYDVHMSEKSTDLENFYEGGIFELETEKKGKEKRPVVWSKAQDLVECVVEKRNYTGNFFLNFQSYFSLNLKGINTFFKCQFFFLPKGSMW